MNRKNPLTLVNYVTSPDFRQGLSAFSQQKQMKRYDLHIHTKYSQCSLSKPAKVLETAKKRGLNGVAITDHNTIKGALKVKRLNKDRDFEVIVGEEIKTEAGEILAYYLKKEIKPGRFERVIKEIKSQKAICAIAHPFAHFRKRLRMDFRGIKANLDAVEVLNARALLKRENKKAGRLAEKLNLAMIAGSDAHFCHEIGRAYTLFRGTLRNAIKKKKTTVKGRRAWTGRVLSGVVKLIKKCGLTG